MNSWKEPFNPYILNLFPILIIKLISGLLSIGHYRSFTSAATILFMLVIQKKFIMLWMDQIHKSSSSYERTKNKQVTVLKKIYINFIRIIDNYSNTPAITEHFQVMNAPVSL